MSQPRLWMIGCCTVLSLAVTSVVRADDASWVGKVVITTRPGIQVNVTDESGRGAAITLSKIGYTAEEEGGPLIQVRERGIVCRLAKSDVLLPEDAITYFTTKIHDDSINADAYGRRAYAHAAKGDLDLALKTTTRRYALNPNPRTGERHEESCIAKRA